MPRFIVKLVLVAMLAVVGVLYSSAVALASPSAGVSPPVVVGGDSGGPGTCGPYSPNIGRTWQAPDGTWYKCG